QARLVDSTAGNDLAPNMVFCMVYEDATTASADIYFDEVLVANAFIGNGSAPTATPLADNTPAPSSTAAPSPTSAATSSPTAGPSATPTPSNTPFVAPTASATAPTDLTDGLELFSSSKTPSDSG